MELSVVERWRRCTGPESDSEEVVTKVRARCTQSFCPRQAICLRVIVVVSDALRSKNAKQYSASTAPISLPGRLGNVSWCSVANKPTLSRVECYFRSLVLNYIHAIRYTVREHDIKLGVDLCTCRGAEADEAPKYSNPEHSS